MEQGAVHISRRRETKHSEDDETPPLELIGSSGGQ